MLTLKQLIEKFNIAANTAFNKGYQELNPDLKDLCFNFMSGAVSSTKFPITKIMSKIRKFLGSRVHNSPADSFMVTVENVEYDGSVDIPRRDLLRAQTANSLVGLDIYVKEISSLGMEAKDSPYELVLDMIEAGAANTYGTTFDNQNMFDTTHAFDDKAGTQSNLLTGTGTSDAQLAADLYSALGALRGFYYLMDDEGGNSKKRKLNKSQTLTVVCPDQLVEAFERINKAEYITDGVSNLLKGRISKIISRPFTDANDWYVFDTSEANVKPIIISTEEEAKIQSPSPSDENAKEHKVHTWGIEGFSYGVAYGAWWKAIKIANA